VAGEAKKTDRVDPRWGALKELNLKAPKETLEKKAPKEPDSGKKRGKA
jgi:hypothetical protein